MLVTISRMAAGPVSRRVIALVVDQPMAFKSARLAIDVRGKSMRFRQNPHGSLQCSTAEGTTTITTVDKLVAEYLSSFGVNHGKSFKCPCAESEFGGELALTIDLSSPQEVLRPPGLEVELVLSSSKDKFPTFRAGQLKGSVPKEFLDWLSFLRDGTEAIFTFQTQEGPRPYKFKKCRANDWYGADCTLGWTIGLPEVGTPARRVLLEVEVAGRRHSL